MQTFLTNFFERFFKETSVLKNKLILIDFYKFLLRSLIELVWLTKVLVSGIIFSL